MKAWVVRRLGGPETMQFEDVDASAPADGMVRIAIRASAINYFDALMVAGTYQTKPELPFVPGVEISGEVESAPAATAFKKGDRVTALLDSGGLTRGGYAELADAAPATVHRLPDAMPFDDGAAFTLIYQTAWFGLHRRANLQPGETLLVHAGAGGVGSAAIQLGKAAGATVIATAGSDEKTAVCTSLGADHVINYKTQDFSEEVKTITGGRGADVVFDPVGGDVFDGSTRCIAFEGRLLLIGFTSGRIAEVAANRVLLKNISVVGVHWGLYRQREPTMVRRWMVELLNLAEAGQLKPIVWKTFPLRRAPQALAAIAARESHGKVVVIP